MTADVVQKLRAHYIPTIEILLEYTEGELIELGLQKGIVRIMLRKAKEIADTTSAS